LTQAQGHDTSRHVLACFGGAGGQHACAIARALGMSTVFVHRYSGILSAYGMALADVVHEAQEPSAAVYGAEAYPLIDGRINELKQRCVLALEKEGFKREHIDTEPYLHLRYEGTDCALMCTAASDSATQDSCQNGDFKASFLERYEREFGFTISERPIIVDDIRVRGVGRTEINLDVKIAASSGPAIAEEVVAIYYEGGYQDTGVYQLYKLLAGHTLTGPALIIDKNSTILVEPGCEAVITANGDVRIAIGGGNAKRVGTNLDSIQLSIFSHRFMSTAEQMGRVLQRTSISTNIKERLDFSCAMFGPDGGLVANAPHIPVHLGAMQETVQYQMRQLGDRICEGDVILSNHPQAGGSHLPDLTVITPVFYPGQPKPVFFVASRGHHADIGGSTPGSMPPHSRTIFEEGAVFHSFFLVKKGVFQEEAVTAALNDPAKYPDCVGTRNLHDNLSDLRAQVASNQKGIKLVHELIDEYGLDVVQAYMAHIQNNAEVAVREMLREIAARTREKTGKTSLYAVDKMDDGSEIHLAISIDEVKGDAKFDFTGTTPEMYGNTNAPRAVTLSALIYTLRCMVGHDVPLNQGCLKPIQVVIPHGCLLDPSATAAVVGGNVLTSQRVVDVVLKAFTVCAASQGCMNNITFGDEDFGYYETVAGGAGAGPTWDGRGGVHTHMTNTRITDPEILERRYPVMLKRFNINPGTGGAGQFRGGDGVIRELLFRKPITLSVLTERRVFQPYGLNGGCPGELGRNHLLCADGRRINLGGKVEVKIKTGDVFQLLTPGGGGYGKPTEDAGEHGVKRRRTDAVASQKYQERGSVHAYKLAQESA